ncbi:MULTISPECIES: ABC transporter permease [Pseudomonas]|uniref:Lipopolysaccharide transport system permease protein n=1 Tax=Pseudomonas lutea TaxID=243924 RepID=A0A9X8QJE5_9PSED|nr:MULTISPECIES: ABC transporter permease [Pseudomonas]SEQ48834.1 lipopolysaccharide transport system permease protein [Pseudomonas lutea]
MPNNEDGINSMHPGNSSALNDIYSSIKRSSLIGLLGWQDVRQRYKRSALGPFWLTISMGVMIGTMGLVFGNIFNATLYDFLPFLSLGIIFWTFLSSSINENCTAFIAGEGIIKQLPIPLFVHIARVIWRNLLILAHNIVIFPAVLIAVGRPVDWLVLLSIPALVLTIVNVAWISLLLATVCARYRDLPQIVGSLLQVMFYLTPIMWMPNLLDDEKVFFLLQLNPLFHVLDILRSPLMGETPDAVSWYVCISTAVIGWIFTLYFYSKYKQRIAYWL